MTSFNVSKKAGFQLEDFQHYTNSCQRISQTNLNINRYLIIKSRDYEKGVAKLVLILLTAGQMEHCIEVIRSEIFK